MNTFHKDITMLSSPPPPPTLRQITFEKVLKVSRKSLIQTVFSLHKPFFANPCVTDFYKAKHKTVLRMHSDSS